MAYSAWLPEEIEYIKNNANHMTDKEVMKNINNLYGQRRSFDTVRKMRQRIGIQKENGRGVCKIKDIDNEAVETRIAIAKQKQKDKQ